MKKLLLPIALISSVLISCNKDKTTEKQDLIDSIEVVTMKLDILKNNEISETIIYTDSSIISTEDYLTNTRKDYSFTKDSIVVSIFKVEKIFRKEVYKYSSNNEITNIDCYNFSGNNSVFEESKSAKYLNNKLSEITGNIPQVYKYNGDNIIEFETVNDNGIKTKYKYSYFSTNNNLSNIKTTKNEVRFTSKNAIKLVTAEWTEINDNMDFNNPTSPTIDHIDTLYSSTYKYDSNDRIEVEYRKNKTQIDTLRYVYTTVNKWIKK